ncbi:hypothetical protein Tco_0087414 [Tanacetum coccineum]
MQTTCVVEEAATMPHDSPLPRVHLLRSDEGSMTLHELIVLCTILSNKVESLESDLKQTKLSKFQLLERDKLGSSEGSSIIPEVLDELKDNSEKQAGNDQTSLTLSSAKLEIQSMVDVPIHQEDPTIQRTPLIDTVISMILRSLEMLVGGRNTETDRRLLQRTISLDHTYDTYARNPVNEILLNLNLPDHRSVLMEPEVHVKMEMEIHRSSKVKFDSLLFSERFANTAYGFFLGKKVAYPVVANYVRNTWGKYGLVRSMFSSSTRLFSFQLSSVNGLDAMLENGPWFIWNNPLILKKLHPDENL